MQSSPCPHFAPEGAGRHTLGCAHNLHDRLAKCAIQAKGNGQAGHALVTHRRHLDRLAIEIALCQGDHAAAIVVVQHLSAHYPSALVELLSRRTSLAVRWAVPGERVRPQTVYLAPPDYHMIVTRGRILALTQTPYVQFTRSAADLLFASVADVYGARAIGVVLPGMGRDGAAGVRAIKGRGGRVVVQDAATARARAMPQAALATGCADFALPLPLIASALVSLVMVPGAAALLQVSPSRRAGLPAIG